MEATKKSKVIFWLIMALILVLSIIILKDRIPTLKVNSDPSGGIVVNPPTIKPGDQATKITHTVKVPPKVDRPIKVPDVITGSGGQINNGEATITPTADGLTVAIPETIIAVSQPSEARWKLASDLHDLGIGYEAVQLGKASLDVTISPTGGGVGVSYNVYRGMHIGIEELIPWNGQLIQTRAYISIPLMH